MNIDATIIATIGGLVATYAKIYFDNRKNKRDITGIIKDRVSGLEDKMNSFAMDFSKYKKDALFRMKFRNAIAERASTIMVSSRALKSLYDFNSVLMDWVHYTQDFGLKYWYSSYRLCNNPDEFNQKDLSDYIELDLTSSLNSFEQKLRNRVKGEKAVMLNNKRIPVTFSDYIKTTKCYIHSELILIDLVKNGFEEDGKRFISLFEKYTMDFVNSFIDAVFAWRELPDYDTLIAKELDL